MLKNIFFQFFVVVKTANAPKIHFFVKKKRDFLFSVRQSNLSRTIVSSCKT